jgi:hypothetical protein
VHLSFLFGFLLTGNIIDNISTPQGLAVGMQIVLGLIWILTGLWIRESIRMDGETTYSSLIIYLANFGELASSGVILINILQIYNWTSHKMICTMMSVYFGTQFLGYLTPVPLVHGFFVATTPPVYITLGSSFILFGVAELYFFFWLPSQYNIYVD